MATSVLASGLSCECTLRQAQASTSQPKGGVVTDAVDIVLLAFRAVERRDLEALEALYHPEVEFHWPPSLSYGGSARGREVFHPKRRTWGETWNPLQPTERERKMDPRVVAASGNE